jgi:PPOX class probable F420-dependent enzyme
MGPGPPPDHQQGALMQPMSEDRRRAFLLSGTRTGHLATTRADGSAHVAPIWFVLDGDDVLFTTGADTVKGRNLRRDPRTQLSVDQPEPPFAFVTVTGRVELLDDVAGVYQWALQISRRYMGDQQAEAYARRNAVPGELLVRLRPERFVAVDDVAGW